MSDGDAAPGGLAAVVAQGTTRTALEAVRDDLATRLACCGSDRDAAALAARLVDVLARLDEMPTAAKGTLFDELERKRAERGKVAARPARARRG